MRRGFTFSYAQKYGVLADAIRVGQEVGFEQFEFDFGARQLDLHMPFALGDSNERAQSTPSSTVHRMKVQATDQGTLSSLELDGKVMESLEEVMKQIANDLSRADSTKPLHLVLDIDSRWSLDEFARFHDSLDRRIRVWLDPQIADELEAPHLYYLQRELHLLVGKGLLQVDPDLQKRPPEHSFTVGVVTDNPLLRKAAAQLPPDLSFSGYVTIQLDPIAGVEFVEGKIADSAVKVYVRRDEK